MNNYTFTHYILLFHVRLSIEVR